VTGHISKEPDVIAGHTPEQVGKAVSRAVTQGLKTLKRRDPPEAQMALVRAVESVKKEFGSDHAGSDAVWDALAAHIQTAFIRNTSNERFPFSADEYDEEQNRVFMATKEINDLKRSLLWLRKNRGVEWIDLHQGNVMVQPSTGDLVIIDVGEFR